MDKEYSKNGSPKKFIPDQYNFTTFVIHYSKLIDRFAFLSDHLNAQLVSANWITENNFNTYKWSDLKIHSVFGISEKILGMDLGVNSRSLVTSRRKARIQGWILYLRSFLRRRENLLTTGSLPNKTKLDQKWLEALSMNITALEIGVNSPKDWILILEDDALPLKNSFEIANSICENYSGKIWINLNSGANLTRTKSDPQPNKYGLFRVRPAATRCSVAVLISKELALEMLENINKFGLPTWLPTDVCFQALLRKTRAKAYWQEPATFIQGSEEGVYKSNLR